MNVNLEIITGEGLNEIKDKEKIGGGGFGIVYKAKWRGQRVAIKELKANDFSQTALDDFQRECQMMSKLRCNHLVGLYAITQEPYGLIMECMEGGSICERLKSDKEDIPWVQRYRWAKEVGKGIEFLHVVGVFHGNIRSENVLLTKTGQAKLGDLGLSKLAYTRKSTQTSCVGTYPWMAPELLQDIKHTIKNDIYSYGVLLWEIASRKEPFNEVEMKCLIPEKMLMGDLKLEIPEETPKAFGEIIHSCCDLNPDKRPPLKDVISLLRQMLEEEKEKIAKQQQDRIVSFAFGEEKWKATFGDPGTLPRLPANIGRILSSPCPFWQGKSVYETHLLVVIPATVDGNPLTLNLLGKLIRHPKSGHATRYRSIYDKIVKEYGDKPCVGPYWVIMTKDFVEGTKSKSFQAQQDIIRRLGKGLYRAPTLLEAAVCILVEYAVSGNRLYSDNPECTYTHCQEEMEGGQTAIGGFTSEGLYISSNGTPLNGLGCIRKF